MPKLRKGELKFYKMMNPIELEKYLFDFPQNTEYVKEFLEDYHYNWRNQEWVKGGTIK